MADLIIGGSTYKNIDYAKIKKADGTIATFVDADTAAQYAPRGFKTTATAYKLKRCNGISSLVLMTANSAYKMKQQAGVSSLKLITTATASVAE